MSGTQKALVLGGGGVLGISWETGVLAGLASAGIDVLDAGIVVGTSAGATVAAQVTTTPIEKLYQDQLDGTGAPEPAIDIDMTAVMANIAEIKTEPGTPEAVRAKIGAIALERDRVPESERRALIEARLAHHEWPQQQLRITTIDAETGEFVVLGNDSGVSLVDAVAASCAIPVVWPAVTIDGRRYYDGGFRSFVNADVAEGFAKILVLEVANIDEMSDVKDVTATSDVFTITLDDASVEAIGENKLDPTRRPAAAKAGYEQGVRIADEVRAFWSA